MKKLTERQRKFADEYLKCGNAYQSAIKVGYSENYSKGRSHELLENVGVKAYIEKAQEEMRKNNIADTKEILEYLTNVMRKEEREEVVTKLSKKTFKKNGEMEVVEYTEINEVAPKISDRTKAAELLGKRYSLFTDRQQDADMTVTNSIVDALIKKAGGVIESD